MSADTAMMEQPIEVDDTPIIHTIPYIDSQYHYTVTAQRTTATTHALYTNITTATHNTRRHLVCAKNTYVELYDVSADYALTLLATLPIYGRILHITAVPLARTKPDHHITPSHALFVLCESGNYCFVQYDMAGRRAVTLHSGTIQHNTTALAEDGPHVIVDTKHRSLLIHMYTGTLQVIDIGDLVGTQAARSYTDVRIDILTVKGMTQQRDINNNICLTILYQDTKQRMLVKQCELKRDKQLVTAVPVPNGVMVVDSTTTHILSTAQNGIIAISQSAVTYYSSKAFTSANSKSSARDSSSGSDVAKTCSITPTRMTCVANTNESTRFLCSDLANNLYIIILTVADATAAVQSIACEYIGQVTVASSIAYIDDVQGSLLYAASMTSDSQLLQLNNDADENGSYVSVVHTQTNVGPIRDATVLTMNGQPQLVTCSGAWRNGTLRIIKQGISVNVEASIDLDGVTSLFSLTTSSQTYLLLSFVDQTLVLATNESDEMSEMKIESIVSAQPTVYACSIASANVFIQVTHTTVQLIDATTLQLVATHQTSQAISAAQYDGGQLLIAAGRHLILLNVTSTALSVAHETSLPHEVSCLALYTQRGMSLTAVGQWQSNTVSLYSLPQFTLLATETTPHSILPRSVVIAQLEANTTQMFVGLGDGKLVSYTIDHTVSTQPLKNAKSVQIGTQPLFLTSYTGNNNSTHVFVSCDKPCVVASQRGKLLYNPVHQQHINAVCTYNTPTLGNCLVFATKQQLVIGHIDQIQKLHVQTVPLQCEPICIQHSNVARAYVVGCLVYEHNDAGHDEAQYVRLYNDVTYDMLLSYRLDNTEAVNCVKLVTIGDANYIAVGTAYVNDTDKEPTSGRVLVFEVPDKQELRGAEKQRQLTLITQCKTRGSVNSIDSVSDRIVCGVNNRVEVYMVTTADMTTALKLEREVSHRSHVNVIKVHVVGSYIVVADAISSLKLLLYKPADLTHKTPAVLEQVACDYTCHQVSASCALSSDVFIAADNAFNLYILRRNLDGITDEEKNELVTIGRMNTSERVNCILEGSIVQLMNVDGGNTAAAAAGDSQVSQVDIAESIRPTHLYCTVSGMIGVLAPLTKQQFTTLTAVEEAVAAIQASIGGFSYSDYRAYRAELTNRTINRQGMVDGDMVEAYLELSRSEQDSVASTVGISRAELNTVVEELTRIH